MGGKFICLDFVLDIINGNGMGMCLIIFKI